jgi:5-methylcytosine-specific restriction endonuclease McrA
MPTGIYKRTKESNEKRSRTMKKLIKEGKFIPDTSNGFKKGYKQSEKQKENIRNLRPHNKGEFHHDDQSKEKMSLSHRKEKTWCWDGGTSQNYYKRLIQYLHINMQCEECGSKKYTVIHHRNRNRKDNRIENLKILCRSCHHKEHGLLPPWIKIKKIKVSQTQSGGGR